MPGRPDGSRNHSYLVFEKLPLWKNFDDIITCDLWFKASPNQKILGMPMNWRSPEKIF